ncbi:MAG: hypothetical protein LBL32_00455 [Holosporales bacterium]|jgi:hypothetical protein|nr:hypothetical protein [Holosporales bacterium]
MKRLLRHTAILGFIIAHLHHAGATMIPAEYFTGAANEHVPYIVTALAKKSEPNLNPFDLNQSELQSRYEAGRAAALAMKSPPSINHLFSDDLSNDPARQEIQNKVREIFNEPDSRGTAAWACGYSEGAIEHSKEAISLKSHISHQNKHSGNFLLAIKAALNIGLGIGVVYATYPRGFPITSFLTLSHNTD